MLLNIIFHSYFNVAQTTVKYKSPVVIHDDYAVDTRRVKVSSPNVGEFQRNDRVPTT